MGTTLVTGATGTTGSRTAARLVAAGHRVRAASRHAT
ncbi:ergot alkaloid biosynthesis protein, partial [Streptomyces sp. SID486]|nr:ergot alkaloid biosynthesis protein [Streptomyces sp. SID486]